MIKGFIFLYKLSLVWGNKEKTNFTFGTFGLITVTDWAKPIVSGRMVISA